MKKILIVDDYNLTRKMIRSVLSIEGYETQGASSFVECLDILKTFTPDLILMDLMFFGNGNTLTKTIKKMPEMQGVPIICFSGSINPIIDPHNFVAVVIKPILPSDLLDVVRHFIR